MILYHLSTNSKLNKIQQWTIQDTLSVTRQFRIIPYFKKPLETTGIEKDYELSR